MASEFPIVITQNVYGLFWRLQTVNCEYISVVKLIIYLKLYTCISIVFKLIKDSKRPVTTKTSVLNKYNVKYK